MPRWRTTVWQRGLADGHREAPPDPLDHPAVHPDDGEVAFYIHPRDRERFEEERGAFAAAHGIRVVVRPDIPEGSIMTMAFREGDDDPWEDTYEFGEEVCGDDEDAHLDEIPDTVEPRRTEWRPET